MIEQLCPESFCLHCHEFNISWKVDVMWHLLESSMNCYFGYDLVPGIFSPLEMVDFGMLRTLDEPSTVQLNLINSGSKAVQITVSLRLPFGCFLKL